MPEDNKTPDQEQQEVLLQLMRSEKIAKQFMTPQAIQRYGNLKLTHPEIAIKAILIISKAAQSRQLNQKIDDQTFKNILSQIHAPRKDFRILKK